MGILLTLSEIYIPPFIQKRKLSEMFGAAANAFEVSVPSINGLSHHDCLASFALFTRVQAEKSIEQGNELKVQSRLFQNAYLIGREIKADFNIQTRKDVMRMAKVVYKALKIDFQGELQGNIEIKQCFFSTYYSGHVCTLISSLDEGLLAGISGGDKLTFSQRITKGNDCCLAYLKSPGRTE